MKKFLFLLGILLLNIQYIVAQTAQIEISMAIVEPTVIDTIWIGLDQTATNGIDPHLGESDLPPLPPAGVFDIRFDLTDITGSNLSSQKDFRPVTSFPFSDVLVHRLAWQRTNGTPRPGFAIQYNIPNGASVSIVDEASGGSVFNLGPLTGSGTTNIPTGNTTAAIVTVTYTNVQPVVVGPVFSINPAAPLLLPNTAVGSSNNATVTVTNTGADTLKITNVTSSDAQFMVSPTTANITTGSQVFTVTFTPTSEGSHSSTLTFSHNGPGPNTTYTAQGVGAGAGPSFSVSTNTLDFSNVGVGDHDTLHVTVTNTGLLNALNISGVSASPSQYSVFPTTANIPASGSALFNVVFSPTAGGVLPGTLTFTHNAPGSPSSVALTGNGIATFGLVFAEDTLYRKEDSLYTDVIQLKSLSATAQAIQFRLLVNKSSDDNSILTFLNIEKGADVNSSNWSLDKQVFRGQMQANGSSVDSIYVILYDLNQNGGLAAGDYDSLLKVSYRVADLPALVDTSKSSFRISNAEASTFQGFPINITPSRDELSIFATNRISSVGDVNGDGSLDILDLINVVDHILGRDSLSAQEFVRADIAPWTVGSLVPSPDGFVNVQDLALIQNIILTGFYPDGTTLNKSSVLAKSGSSTDAKAIFYISSEGISVHLDAKVAIRGAQLEFENVTDAISNMIIDSRLGDGFYNQSDELLRVLLYDRAGNDVIEAGENFVANLPFTLSNPQEISVDKIILVNTDKEKLINIQVEVVYGNSPDVPIDYALFQNYPNPFNPNTTVRFSVPQTDIVNLTIYNALGEEVRTLFSGQIERGTYAATWDGKDNSGRIASSGMYIYKMSAGSFSQSKKMMFLK